MTRLRFRSIWISDVHLGTRTCKANYLIDFLHHTDSQYLYLVGDIIDFWNLKNGWYWPSSHNKVLQTVMEKAAQGTRVIYVPGNHDEVFHDYAGVLFGGVEVRSEAIHTTADGRLLLVVHGDAFDRIVRHSRLLVMLGSGVYELLLLANRGLNFVRRRLGFPYWSFAAYLKGRVRNAVKYIQNFEHALVHEAHKRGMDGVVCGHIHKAAIEMRGGTLYCNDGDWVESCTSLVERQDGTLAVIRWADESVFLLDETKYEDCDSNGRLVSTD